MPSWDIDPRWLLAAAALLVALLLVALGAAWGRARAAAASRARMRRGVDGERTAEHMLRAEGFVVRARQVVRQGSIELDGVAHAFAVRADLLVERDGRRWLVEVKTGETAGDALFAPTRRQLHEYARVFDVAEILLVDVVAGRIVHVRFP